MGAKYVETLEIMTKVKRAPIDVVLPNGVAVINANDPAIADLGTYCEGDVMYFGLDSQDVRMKNALAAGKRIVTIDRGIVVLAQGDRKQALIPTADVPHSFGGQLAFQLENGLAAIAAACALDIGPNQIAEGLRKAAAIEPSSFCCFELAGAAIVLSLCRNTSALCATIAAIETLFTQTRRAAIYSICADQRPQDALEQGVRLGQAFEEVTIASPNDTNDLMQLLSDELMSGISSAGRAKILHRESAKWLATVTERVEAMVANQLLLVQATSVGVLASAADTLVGLGAKRVSQLWRAQTGPTN
jgi:cyanophycin synthetase